MRWLVAIALVILSALPTQAGVIMRGSGNVAPAGIAHGRSTSGQDTNSTTSYTLAHNLSTASGNNRLLIVGATIDVSGGPVLSCTYAGTSMTALEAASVSNLRVAQFYLLDASLPATSGSDNIVCSSTVSGYIKIIASDFVGVKQSAPDDHDIASVSGATISVATTVTTAKSLVYSNSANVSSSATYSGHTENANVVAELEGGSAHVATGSWIIKATPGDQTMSDTATSDSQAITAAVFAPAGS